MSKVDDDLLSGGIKGHAYMLASVLCRDTETQTPEVT